MMQASRFVLAFAALTTVFVASGCVASAPPKSATGVAIQDVNVPVGYSQEKRIHFSFTIHNTTPHVVRDAEFRTYAPVKQTAHQFTRSVTASHPFDIQADDLNNQVLQFKFKEIPPYGTKVVSIRAELRMAPSAHRYREGDDQRFMGAEPFIESTDPQVVRVASQLRTDMPAQTASATYDWIVGNLKAETFIAEDRGAAYALKNKYGDCTEFAYLFTAMNRANAIPTRAVGGYVNKGNAVLKAVDYHNWAEFKVDETWQIADPQKQALMSNQTDYIAMRIITADNDGTMSNSHRFHYAGTGLIVTMN